LDHTRFWANINKVKVRVAPTGGIFLGGRGKKTTNGAPKKGAQPLIPKGASPQERNSRQATKGNHGGGTRRTPPHGKKGKPKRVPTLGRNPRKSDQYGTNQKTLTRKRWKKVGNDKKEELWLGS